MTRKITTIGVFLLVCLGAAGQTPITYTVPPGTSCRGVVFILSHESSSRADSLAQRAKCQLDGGSPSVT